MASDSDDLAEYVERASNAIVQLLREEYSMVHPELEARIAEGYNKGDSRNIDPHHVTTALRLLYANGKIVTSTVGTRGSQLIDTLSLTAPGRRLTAVQRTAARKRLLLARYRGWSQGTKRNPQGLIGPAGEAATRTGILDSNMVRPVEPGAAEVSTLLGTKLPGPADSAGFYVPTLNGIPQSPITLLIEVKNLRSWIYPSSIELYQPLSKAVLVQQANPAQPLVPVLVCRRAHKTLFWMANQLGFIAIELDTQFAGNVDSAHLDEIRTELHFHDLRIGNGPSLRVRDRLRSNSLMAKMPEIASRWGNTAHDPTLAKLINKLSKERRDGPRARLVEDLRAHNRILGNRGGW